MPTGASDLDTLFLSVAPDKSFTTIQDKSFSSPAQSNCRWLFQPPCFGCNCPDYLAREDFNLYKYAQKKTYPYTGVQDLKPGTYDAGTNTFDGERPVDTVTFQVSQELWFYLQKSIPRSCRRY